MKTGLVLGGGGLVGMAYHAGVLKALDDHDIDVGGADLLVGTSAGSIMASYLAAGWTPDDFFEYGMGRHAKAPADEESDRGELKDIFTPLWHSPSERVRRSIGSLFAAAASRGYYIGGSRGRSPNSLLRKAFPAGLYSTDRSRERLSEDLPQAWPRDGLYICTAELYSGRRVVFGSSGAPDAPLPDAVLASTAIPGVFPPVRIGGKQYVDGGIYSGTSLDLAAEAGCESILCVAPLGYLIDQAPLARDPRLWSPMFVRGLFARTLRREVRAAREKGVEVLVIRPPLSELKTHGTNSMRAFDRKGLINSTRDSTNIVLEQHAEHPALVALKRKRKGEEKRWSRSSTA